jgi:hypothetical protein
LHDIDDSVEENPREGVQGLEYVILFSRFKTRTAEIRKEEKGAVKNFLKEDYKIILSQFRSGDEYVKDK